MSIGKVSRSRRVALGLAVLALLAFAPPVSSPALAESGGETRDMVTGWRCISHGCDTLIMPGTRCLCQKINPGETRLSRLRLTCIPPSGSPYGCPLPKGVAGN